MTIVGMEEKVAEIVAQQMNKEIKEVKEINLFAQLEADELDCIEIIMRLEEEFNIEISDTQAEELISINAVTSYLKNKLALEK